MPQNNCFSSLMLRKFILLWYRLFHSIYVYLLNSAQLESRMEVHNMLLVDVTHIKLSPVQCMGGWIYLTITAVLGSANFDHKEREIQRIIPQ